MKTILFPILLLLCCLNGAAADELAYPNRYSSMAESMFDMMDAFSSAYQKRTTQDGGYNSGWSPNTLPPGGGMGNVPGMGGFPSYWSYLPGMNSFPGTTMPFSGFPNSQAGPAWPYNRMQPQNWGRYLPEGRGPVPSPMGNILDGSWQGQSGELLVIQGDRFRIYLQRNDYRDGRLSYHGNRWLTMHDPATGQSRRYEYAESDGRLALRDEADNLLLYRRIQR